MYLYTERKLNLFMNQEEDIRTPEPDNRKPRRVFGEEDLAERSAPKPAPRRKSPAEPEKKVDKAIRRSAPMADETETTPTRKKPAPAKKTPARKSGKKKKSKAGATFMRLGRGLKTGSVTVTEYSKKAMRIFDAFTAGDADVDDTFLRRLKTRFRWLAQFRFSTFILATVVVLALTLTFFNNTNIQVENVTVSVAGLSDDLEGYTICLISDMHGREFGSRQATLLRAINGETYDLLVMAGDMVGQDGNAQPLYDLIDGLTGGKPVYFVAGDSDPGPLREEPNVVEGPLEEFVLEDWVLGAMDRGAVYLDSPKSILVDDSTIWLTPESMMNIESSSTISALNQQMHLETDEVLEEKQAAYNALPFTSYRLANMQEMQLSIQDMETEDLHISVGHIPPCSTPRSSDGSDGYLPTADLLLAGHHCGGVWKLPILGAIYIPSVEAPRHGWFPSQSSVEGLSMLGSINMYISGGLGVTDRIYLPDFRLNNQPKVTLIHLTAKLTDDLLGISE